MNGLLRAVIRLTILSTVAVTLLVAAEASSVRAGAASTTSVIVSWTDGDTVRIRMAGLVLRVRLIGIDTPESSPNSRAELQMRELGRDLETILALGRAAKAAAERIAPAETTVRVEYDVQRLDRYARTLAYLYLADGRMINEELVRQGWALVLTIPPNVRYADRFVRAQQQAREQRRGLWGSP